MFAIPLPRSGRAARFRTASRRLRLVLACAFAWQASAQLAAYVMPELPPIPAIPAPQPVNSVPLGDINAFFATPSGHALASQYMQLWLDPDTIRSIFGSVPEMMKLMPEMMQKFKAANDQFPEPPAKAKPAKE